MGMFDKRLEVGIATAAAILTTATSSFSPQIAQLTLPPQSPASGANASGASPTSSPDLDPSKIEGAVEVIKKWATGDRSQSHSQVEEAIKLFKASADRANPYAAQETETMKALNTELDRSPQERKDEITQRLEGQIARLGRGLQLEPKQDESVQDYKARAEGRANDLLKLNALRPSAIQNKEESFEDFSARVVREYLEDNTKRNAEAKTLATELNKK
jgi:hypothetical protein